MRLTSAKKLTLLLISAVFCALVFLIPVMFISAQNDDSCLMLYPTDMATGKGEYTYVDCPALDTPSPTATPTATQTPVATIAPTDTPEPTPTIEDMRTPSPTPVPTNTPTAIPTSTPLPEKCIAVVSSESGLYVRDKPYGNSLGLLAQGDILTLESYWDYTNEFGDVSRWYGHYWLPQIQGYSHGGYLSISGNCDDLPDMTPENPPESTLIVGLHPIPGASRDESLLFQQALQDAGIQSGVKPYHSVEYCLDSLTNSGVCVYRVPPDCPRDVGGDDPRDSAYEFMSYRDSIVQSTFSNYVDTGRLWIELTNECNYDQYLAWWSTWFDSALDYAEQHNWPPLALGSLGPGHGSYAMFSAWKAPLMRNHAAGGLFAMHSYSPPELCGGSELLSTCDPWCACRHRTNYDFVEVLNYDIQITITEAAPGWGNTQISTAILQDNAEWIELIENDEGLHSVFFWLLGYHPIWPKANLAGHTADFAYWLTH